MEQGSGHKKWPSKIRIAMCESLKFARKQAKLNQVIGVDISMQMNPDDIPENVEFQVSDFVTLWTE